MREKYITRSDNI